VHSVVNWLLFLLFLFSFVPNFVPFFKQTNQFVQTNGAFDVLHGEQELQESLVEVIGNLSKGRAVIVEFNDFFINKVGTVTAPSLSHALPRTRAAM
jgi:hypothetical protein